jgi:ATP/maltotriose-dependent transcriptional regulator MalT
VLARLGGLGAETVELARAVAVLGRRVELRDAAGLASLGEEDASAAADRLVGAGVFERGRPIEFVHAIVRQAIYEDIAPGERATLHARAARLLAARHAEPELVASHLLSTEPAGDEWAYERLAQASDRALERGSPAIAIDFLRRALAESPAESIRPALLARLGSLEVRAGRREGIPRLRDAHTTSIEPAARAEIARELGNALIFSGHATEAAALLVRAIDELEGTTEAPRQEILARLESLLLAAGVVTSGAHELASSRYRLLEQRIAELPERAARLVSAPLALERVTCGGTAALGIHLARRALGEGRLLAEEGPESPVVFVAVAALLWADQVAEAEATTSSAVARVEAEGSARGLALTLPSRALVRLRRGGLADAEADARQALALSAETGGWLVFRMIAAAVAATVALERGEVRAAQAMLDEVAEVPHDPDAVLTQPLREARARLWMATGEPERALSTLVASRERERVWGIRAVVPIPWRSHAALAHLALGSREEARALALEELELAQLFDAPRPIGIAMRALGLVEGGDRGLELLSDAADALAASSDRLEHARALVDLGGALRREGHKSDARAPLREGLDLARTCGATALAERAYDELHATGARPRKILRSGLDALTPSERRVATMAADGMSNREIAQSLFITPKTVEVHLSHAYAKLEISSRKELPRALGV